MNIWSTHSHRSKFVILCLLNLKLFVLSLGLVYSDDESEGESHGSQPEADGQSEHESATSNEAGAKSYTDSPDRVEISAFTG